MSTLSRCAATVTTGLVAAASLALVAPSATAAAPKPKPVTFCSDARYQGDCDTTKTDIDFIFDDTAVGNDRLSSVKIKAGTWVALYRDANFTGPCQSFSSSVKFLGGTLIENDTVSSARITTSQIEDCPTS